MITRYVSGLIDVSNAWTASSFSNTECRSFFGLIRPLFSSLTAVSNDWIDGLTEPVMIFSLL